MLSYEVIAFQRVMAPMVFMKVSGNSDITTDAYVQGIFFSAHYYVPHYAQSYSMPRNHSETENVMLISILRREVSNLVHIMHVMNVTFYLFLVSNRNCIWIYVAEGSVDFHR